MTEQPKPETGDGYVTRERVVKDVQLSRKFDKTNAALKKLIGTGQNNPTTAVKRRTWW